MRTLADAHRQRIDQHCRQNVQENHVDFVHHGRFVHVKGQIVDGTGERIVETVFDVVVGELAPGQWVLHRRHIVVDRYVFDVAA